MNSPAVEQGETIVAIATPPGVGGVGIVRLSGRTARQIAEQIAGTGLQPRTAHHRVFRDPQGNIIDNGIVLLFPAPGSYTGEDVVELQGHGSPIILQELLNIVRAAGARLARPGEFTERAFLNGKMDLAQAEAVADLIHAQTLTAARLARNSLEGALAQEIEPLAQYIEDLRVQIEADIDFGETDLEDSPGTAVALSSQQLAGEIRQRMEELRPLRIYTQGVRVALAGAPNVGKSSLMNALAGQEIAIVTEIPGTTRDILRTTLSIHGIPVEMVDMAGMRESNDPVEKMGIERARSLLETTDLILEVRDLTRPTAIVETLGPKELARLIVWNKVDRVSEEQILQIIAPDNEAESLLCISAEKGSGLERLREAIHRKLGALDPGEGGFSVRTRHLEALENVCTHLLRIHPEQPADLMAENLRLAARALDAMLGRGDHEQLLGKIFSGFCIGK